MIPRCQFAGLESSQLDDAPKSGTPWRVRVSDFRFAGPECCRYHYAPKLGAQSGLGFRDLWFVGPALITHLS